MSEAKHFARGPWNVCGKRNGIGKAINDVDEPGGEKQRNCATARHSQMQTAREHPLPADRDQRCVEADEIQPKQDAARQGASIRVRCGRGAGRLNRTDEKRISGIYFLTFPWMNGLFAIFLEFFAPSVSLSAGSFSRYRAQRGRHLIDDLCPDAEPVSLDDPARFVIRKPRLARRILPNERL